MENLYTFPGTGQNGLRVVADMITVLPFLFSVLLAMLTPLRNIKIKSKGKDLYPLLLRYYHNLVK
ncbi:MAG: hypothetical protein A3G93_04805 [Nitrospinae bacterium RIFCSPLOWO2_12_FULL_45_22]|nr:MAG: hypothetical protein A3G93_04805 [Nitrospinae bacterium RIFCSPLOWO2_12_FULL_45_22]